ncbi:hypothetical protein [Rhodopirellula sp. SWK7]|uniref:hypothetical protein n=1 Tax=Rhodopirellula sp. SWK7 TaxID=595460 RepID=UPI0002BDAC40|nr:hypothetical protein [Rhodopirellula sp. SWK7]EMI47392.1 hypothetical protein RRSWK_00123 [Rhodopirellula sp. SWK7]
MKRLLVEIEKFLRWVAELTPDQRREQDQKIQEMSQLLVDELEPLNDGLELEEDDD